MVEARQNHRPDQRRFQFSLLLLLIVTAGIAVLVTFSLSFYRQQEATRRAMHFRQAVQAGDLKTVDQMLNADSRLAHGRHHAGAQSSHTALQMALGVLTTYNPKIVDRILQEKPDVNETSSGGETALHIAARLNHVSEVRRLIQLGANLNALDDRGDTPLHMAMRADRTGQLLKLVLDTGADPNLLPPLHPKLDWQPPLHVAAESGNAVIVAHLLDAGAQINAQDTSGRTALHLAVADRSPAPRCRHAAYRARC